MGDRYLMLLAAVLAGYAFMGKGFAYLGIPPLFMGEIAFLTGIIIFLQTRCFIAVLATVPSLLLAATMLWVLCRTLPFLGVYGFDALRDSVVIMYGGFAFIVMAVLLEDGRRINTVVRYYGAFVSIYVPVIPFLFGFLHYMRDSIALLPGSNVPIFLIGPSEVTVHLAGAAVFALVGFRKVTPLWIILLFSGVVLPSALSRGGMLSFVIPVAFAALVLGKIREMATTVLVGVVIFSAAYAIETTFTVHSEASNTLERSLSTQQIIDNIASIGGRAGEQTEGTKQWRLQWWDMIVKETIYGPYFWTGRGFGMNMAVEDGIVRNMRAERPLRSPHNVQMTILARAGIPGVVLWGALMVAWFAMLMRQMWIARRRAETGWAGLFLFTACYGMSIFINGTFDVTLEGPMQGVWFWCSFGFGIGSVMVYRAQLVGAAPLRAALVGSNAVIKPIREAR
jgi:hypothetical protein